MPNMSTSKRRTPEAIQRTTTARNTCVEVGTHKYGLCDKTPENPKRARRHMERIGNVAYRLDIPQELGNLHHAFHVSNLCKCLSDDVKKISYHDVQVNEKLAYVEEHVAILERKVKVLRNKEIPIVKVQWNHHIGTEATWEPEADMVKRYPHLL
ncbi:hypothetical protein Tco_0866031 [Tanacetum coccineum]